MLVKRFSTVLLAVITAFVMTLSMSFYMQPAYADDEEPGDDVVQSAIDIVCTGDEDAPLYSDGNKSYEITIDDSADDWGKEGYDWELNIEVTAKPFYDDSKHPILLSPTEGHYYYDAAKHKLTLKGAKIYKTAYSAFGDAFFLVDISVSALIPDETGEGYIELDRAELSVEETDVVELYDYDLESLEKTSLPSMSGFIPKVGEVYVANTKNPYGNDLTYTVTSVTSSNSSVVSLEKTGAGWFYDTLKQGNATLTVYYKSYNGEKQSYQIKIAVRNDMYEVEINSSNGFRGLPGWQTDLTAEVTHYSLDEDGNVEIDNDTSDLNFAWSIYEADEPFIDYDFSDDGQVMEATMADSPEISFQAIDVFCTIQKDNKALCSNETALVITNYYTVMTPLPEEIGSFNVGDTIQPNMQVTEFTPEYPDGKVVDNANVTYDWSWDEGIVELTGDMAAPSIKRLTGDDVFLVAYADWIDDEGEPQWDLQFYEFESVSMNLDDYTVYINDESGYDNPGIVMTADESISLDDLNIEVRYGDEVLNPDKYELEAYAYYDNGKQEFRDPVDPNNLSFECNSRYSEEIGQLAHYCDFTIVAKAKDGSDYIGTTDKYQGFRLLSPTCLDYNVPEIQINDDYWALNFDSWHDYYQIPADKAETIEPIVKDFDKNVLQPGIDYAITYYDRSNGYDPVDGMYTFPTENGHYFAKIEGVGYYNGITFFDFDIGQENPMTAKATTKKVKVSKLKKKKVTVAPITVKNKKGTVTYEKLYGSKKLSVNKKTGKVTVAKKTKKGTYKMSVLVKDSGNKNYFQTFDVVTVKVKVVK